MTAVVDLAAGWLALTAALTWAWSSVRRRHRRDAARRARQRTADLFGGGHVIRVPPTAVGLPTLPAPARPPG